MIQRAIDVPFSRENELDFSLNISPHPHVIFHGVAESIDSIIPHHPDIILHEVAKSTFSKSEGKLPPMREGAPQGG